MSLPSEFGQWIAKDHVEALETAILMSVDQAFADLARLREASETGETIDWERLEFLSWLPERYQHRYDLRFAIRFTACLVVATRKMTDPERLGHDMFACVAEELAAHMVIREAEGVLEIQADKHGLEPPTPTFGGLYEFMFQDVDFKMLYEPDMDGIEDDADAAEEFGLAHLAFRDWFKAFSGKQVHRYVEEG